MTTLASRTGPKREEPNDVSKDLPPPTDDDVGIRLRAGRHLKTRSELIAHFGEDYIIGESPPEADHDRRSA